MDASELLLLLTIAISGPLLAVVFVLVLWRRGFLSTPPTKPKRSAEPIPPSDAKWAQLEADQVALYSTLEKLTTTVKRLSSRKGMEDLRERERAPSVPPPGTPKADLLRHYGVSGKVGPAFAQAQLELEQRSKLQ